VAAFISLNSRVEPGGRPTGIGAGDEADALANGARLEVATGLTAPHPATSVAATAASPGAQRKISTLPPRTAKHSR